MISRFALTKKQATVTGKPLKELEIKPTVAGDRFYTIFFTFENLASSISFFSPSDTTVKAPIILVFSWVNETKTTWNRLLSYSSSSKWLSETFSNNKKRLNEKMSSMKYIPLQRWCNRKNIFPWQILQKLPSTKHKTHRTYDSLGNTFLGFYKFELCWKVSRHAEPFHILWNIVKIASLFPSEKKSKFSDNRINVTLLKTDVSVILQQTLGSLNTWET